MEMAHGTDMLKQRPEPRAAHNLLLRWQRGTAPFLGSNFDPTGSAHSGR